MYTLGNLFGTEVMTYEADGKLFVWSGGTYIDVAIPTDKKECASFKYNGNLYFYSDMCINVWDYGIGKSYLTFGDSVSFIGEIEEWMSA